MNHTVEQLISIARGYHVQDADRARFERGESPEELRQRAAHIRACAKYRDWVAMLQRLQTLFPEHPIENRSIFRQGPEPFGCDLSYSGMLALPVKSADEKFRHLGFMASIVVPYFVIYDRGRLVSGDEYWRIGYEFSDKETHLVRAISRELESTFSGYSLMPEEVGTLIVPGVRTGFKRPGEATIYDCLLSDDW